MQISDAAIKTLKALEGLRLNVYECAAGVETIGYGHVLKTGDKRQITELEAALLLKEDIRRFTAHVSELCRDGGRIPEQHQFDAMVSLAFNIGEEGFTRSSIIRRFLNQDDAGAASAFLYWNKVRRIDPDTGEKVLRPSRALDARRIAEMRMFQLGYYDRTPYEPLDDEQELAALKISRNREPGDKNVDADESEIRPTLKSSRTMKQTTVGTVATGVTGTAAAAGGVSAITREAAESAENVRDIVDSSSGVVEAASETISFMSHLPVIAWTVVVVGAVASLVSFIVIRRARKDDWQRGRR